MGTGNVIPYQSTESEVFQTTAAHWLNETGEILALIRFHARAGSRSFEFFTSNEDFSMRLGELPPQTCVIVFRERQLPLRGCADEALVENALSLIPNGTEWLIVGLEKTVLGSAAWFWHSDGESHEELVSSLRENFANELVAIGPYPPWVEDSSTVISAVVPNPDGSVTTGIY